MNFHHTLLFVVLIPIGSHCTAQEERVASAEAILHHTTNDHLDEALETLGRVVDDGIMISDITETRLPAAVGGVYRMLAQISDDERYELLRNWTLPTQDRDHVRVLSIPVPIHAPPKVFARSIGKRPRDTTFAVARVGEMQGFYCSAWELARAAEAVGRSSRLTVDIEKLVENQVPGSTLLLAFVQVASSRGASEKAKTTLAEHTEGDTDAQTRLNLNITALACASLGKKSLANDAESALEYLASTTKHFKSLLRIAHAVAVQTNQGKSNPSVLYDHPRLKYWQPVSLKDASQNASGMRETMWFSHEEHLLHLAGADRSALFFQFPLMGKFQFDCETQEGGSVGTDGGVVYGGLHYQAIGQPPELTVTDADGNNAVTRPCPFVRHEDTPTFNRISIRSADDSAIFESNFHPMWFDHSASQSSPWLGLWSEGDKRPVFRNLHIKGTPTIPRKVNLVYNDELRGWESSFFEEKQDSFTRSDSTADTPTDQNLVSWRAKSGMLFGQSIAGSERPSLLRYQRPLFEGERITYEFKHGNDQVAVHPAIGRMVFLIRATGIVVRWITDDTTDWTGLPQNNTALEPLSRRGPKTLPIETNAWNRVTVSRAENKILIELGDELIYQRKIDFDGGIQFGFYRESRKQAAEIRSVLLRGDWPETLPDELLEPQSVNLSQTEQDATAANPSGILIGEQVLAQNSIFVRRKALVLESEKRFQILSDWVLPNDRHRSFRMNGYFIPEDSSPLVLADPAFNMGETYHEANAKTFNQMDQTFVSPAMDLIELAVSANKIDMLKERLESTKDRESAESKHALLAILSIVTGDSDGLTRNSETLLKLRQKKTRESELLPWPELTLATYAVKTHISDPIVQDLISELYTRHVKNASDHVPLQNQILHLTSRLWEQQWKGSKAAVIDEPVSDQWIPASTSNAATCGGGRRRAKWVKNQLNETILIAGHDTDFLFFDTPLQGNYTIQAYASPNATAQMQVGDTFFGTGDSLDNFEFGRFRAPRQFVALGEPFERSKQWVRLRAEIQDRVYRLYINGRKLREQTIDPSSSHWVALRGWWKSGAKFRDVSVSGAPKIPASISLSDSPDLFGWAPYYTSMSNKDSHWKSVVDKKSGERMISGSRWSQLDRSSCERLLRFVRPLAAGEAVEYQFFFAPGATNAAPTIGRLTFLIDESGIAEHWITDAQYDQTEVRPDEIRKVGTDSKLVANAWNRMRVELDDLKVSLFINGHCIHEKQLSENASRTFGLFHYADKHELLVRQVMMHGNWPRHLHEIQALSDNRVSRLDQEAQGLPSQFAQNFRDFEETQRYVQLAKPWAGGLIMPMPNGIQLLVTSTGKWSQKYLSPRFSLQGDFDVEAGFEQLNCGLPEKEGSATLAIRLDDNTLSELRTSIGNRSDQGKHVRGQLTLTYPDGTKNYLSDRESDESTDGRLRIARREGMVTFLFAQGSSDRFRIIGTQKVSDVDAELDATKLLAVANGLGQTSVVWTDIKLRAESMKYIDPAQAVQLPMLEVIDLHTGIRRKLAEPRPGKRTVGSPSWSSDAKWIAYDETIDGTLNSRMMVVSVEGGAPVDIGFGSMPTFSSDGKRIAFSAARQGVGTCDSDGTNRTIIDSSGWGAQWSPDGKTIAYTNRGNIVLYDVATATKRTLMTGDAASRYSYLYWNMGWSNDSSMLAFKGKLRNGEGVEMAIIELASPSKLRVLYDGKSNFSPNLNWSPDDKQIVCVMRLPAATDHQLCTLNSDATGTPIYFDRQPVDRRVTEAAWSPDGSKIAITGTPLPVAEEWK